MKELLMAVYGKIDEGKLLPYQKAIIVKSIVPTEWYDTFFLGSVYQAYGWWVHFYDDICLFDRDKATDIAIAHNAVVITSDVYNHYARMRKSGNRI